MPPRRLQVAETGFDGCDLALNPNLRVVYPDATMPMLCALASWVGVPSLGARGLSAWAPTRNTHTDTLFYRYRLAELPGVARDIDMRNTKRALTAVKDMTLFITLQN